MPQLSHEQRQRLFNYFAEAHDLLLLEDDFRMIDDLICSQHDGKPIVSGSLPVDLLRKAYHAGMVEAIKRKCAEEDNYEYQQISFDMWLSRVTAVGGTDR